MFKSPPDDVIDVGVSSSSIWAHFAVVDQTGYENTHTWLLEIDYTMLKRVDIYLLREGTLVDRFDIGYQNPMLSRLLPYRFYIQPLTLQPNDRYDIYINVKREHGNVKVPLKLTRPLKFIGNEIGHNLLLGALFGIVLAMAIYNFFVYLSVGESVYLYYIAYIVFACITFLGVTGYGNLFIWGEFPLVNDYILSISICLAAIMVLQFYRHFVRQEFYSSGMNLAINIAMAMGIALILLKVISGRYLGLEIGIYICLICLVFPIVNLHGWYKGSRAAGFFFMSWILFWLCGIIFFLSLNNILPTNLFTSNAVVVGTASEVLLLSWGLADRINRLKKAEFNALRDKHKTILELKKAEDQILHRTFHRSNTGLPNLHFLESVIEAKLARKDSKPFSLLLVNLNNFHEISKTLGHSNGVAALNEFIAKLKPLSANQPSAMTIEEIGHEKICLASIEGETFAILLSAMGCTTLREIAQSLISEIEMPFQFHDLSLHIEASVGIASYPQDATSSELLLRNAHIALEAANNLTDRSAFYTHEIDPYNERY